MITSFAYFLLQISFTPLVIPPPMQITSLASSTFLINLTNVSEQSCRGSCTNHYFPCVLFSVLVGYLFIFLQVKLDYNTCSCTLPVSFLEELSPQYIWYYGNKEKQVPLPLQYFGIYWYLFWYLSLLQTWCYIKPKYTIKLTDANTSLYFWSGDCNGCVHI